jgi:membrane protease YdiL (CAAX protease family)
MNTISRRIVTTGWFPWDYLSVTFGFSWVCWLPGVLETARILKLPFPVEILILLGIFGPLVGAMWATGRRGGWPAVRCLLTRAFDLRIGIVWWLMILMIPLGLSALAVLGRGLLQGAPADLPVLSNPWTILPTFLLMLLLGGGQEEFGWRGYALDILQERWSALVASLILGLIWGLWHLPLFFVKSAGQYYIPLWAFLLASPALSILTTWVYNSTGKRLFAAILFHAVANTGIDIFPPIEKAAGGDQRAFLILGGLYWLWALLAVGLFGGQRLAGSRRYQDNAT